jgi:hypothetical protein
LAALCPQYVQLAANCMEYDNARLCPVSSNKLVSGARPILVRRDDLVCSIPWRRAAANEAEDSIAEWVLQDAWSVQIIARWRVADDHCQRINCRPCDLYFCRVHDSYASYAGQRRKVIRPKRYAQKTAAWILQFWMNNGWPFGW